MSTTYPGQTSQVFGVHGDVSDTLQAAIMELGANPKGTFADVAARLADMTAKINSGSASPMTNPGCVFFDDYFAGADDATKALNMDAWHQANTGAGPRKTVLFAPRTYSMPTLNWWAGMSLLGSRMAGVREYTTGTKFQATQTNQFKFSGVSNGGYSYPPNGQPRNITIQNILFNGGSTKNWSAPQTSNNGTNVLWMTDIIGCGWTNWLTIFKGYIDGVNIVGGPHIQGCYDTPFTLYGSESQIFGETWSFMDASYDLATGTGYPMVPAGKPFIVDGTDYCTYGHMETTTRQGDYAIRVVSGKAKTFDGFFCGAQGSDATWGKMVQIDGGDGIVFQNCIFDKGMINPSLVPTAQGGAAANRAYVHINGGNQIVFNGCKWSRGSTTPVASANAPLIFTGPAVGQGQVKMGLGNTWSGYAGADAVVQQSVAGQIQVSADTTLSLVTGA